MLALLLATGQASGRGDDPSGIGGVLLIIGVIIAVIVVISVVVGLIMRASRRSGEL
jgi:hypothetical protein